MLCVLREWISWMNDVENAERQKNIYWMVSFETISRKKRKRKENQIKLRQMLFSFECIRNMTGNSRSSLDELKALRDMKILKEMEEDPYDGKLMNTSDFIFFRYCFVFDFEIHLNFLRFRFDRILLLLIICLFFPTSWKTRTQPISSLSHPIVKVHSKPNTSKWRSDHRSHSPRSSIGIKWYYQGVSWLMVAYLLYIHARNRPSQQILVIDGPGSMSHLLTQSN